MEFIAMKAPALRSILLISLSALSAFHTTLSCAADAPIIGLVVWVTGTMKAAAPNAAPRTLARRSPIYETDTITTDKGGSGEIVFKDNSIVSVRNETTLEIAKFRYAKGAPAGTNSEALNLIKGGFRTITGAITKENPQAYKANTPVATIGVAGTVYSAYFDRVANDLFTKLDRGIVYVSNSAGKITLNKSTPAQNSKCPRDVYSKVSASSSPVVVCDQPDIFLSDPPLIPVGFPSSSGGGSVGSFCVTKN
jgi:lipoprotein-anchoring transpeptidase ErfK/SrfK